MLKVSYLKYKRLYILNKLIYLSINFLKSNLVCHNISWKILDLEKDKDMKGDHTKEERNKMQMESQIAREGNRALPSKKGKRVNVQIQNSSLIRPSHNSVEEINPPIVHGYKEGREY